jgi:hypothetical protein
VPLGGEGGPTDPAFVLFEDGDVGVEDLWSVAISSSRKQIERRITRQDISSPRSAMFRSDGAKPATATT